MLENETETQKAARQALVAWLEEHDVQDPCQFCGTDYFSPASGAPWHEADCPFRYVRAALSRMHGLWAARLCANKEHEIA